MQSHITKPWFKLLVSATEALKVSKTPVNNLKTLKKSIDKLDNPSIKQKYKRWKLVYHYMFVQCAGK